MWACPLSLASSLDPPAAIVPRHYRCERGGGIQRLVTLYSANRNARLCLAPNICAAWIGEVTENSGSDDPTVRQGLSIQNDDEIYLQAVDTIPGIGELQALNNAFLKNLRMTSPSCCWVPLYYARKIGCTNEQPAECRAINTLYDQAARH